LKQFEEDVEAGHIELAPIGEDVFADAREIARLCYLSEPQIFLRSLDGIHLGTARKLKCSELITCDRRMQAAAERIGLKH
jgi:predicted nucleic acid-binding protein